MVAAFTLGVTDSHNAWAQPLGEVRLSIDQRNLA
jgi:hypothetical protein